MKVVIARYKEKNLDWIKDLLLPYILYNKSEEPLPEHVKNVINITNIGREEYIYIKYIVDNYHNLDDYTVFTQARPFDAEPKFLEKIRTGDFVPLSRIKKTDDENGFPYHGGLPIRQVCNTILDYDATHFSYHTGAQFVVSKQNIQYRELEWRKRLLKMVEQHQEYMPWVLERLRNLILDGNTPGKLW